MIIEIQDISFYHKLVSDSNERVIGAKLITVEVEYALHYENNTTFGYLVFSGKEYEDLTYKQLKKEIRTTVLKQFKE